MTTTQRLERVPLDQLTTGANVRVELRMTDELVKSVKANGLIQPPVVYPDPDRPGWFRILAGHRRAAAAAKAGLTEIDVIIRDAPDDAERVVDQVVENVHRDALTDAEQASAYRQLALDFGLPAIQIAKRTATKISRIGDAIKVAGSPVAAKILTEHQLTIDDALIFDEFAADDEALEILTTTLDTDPERLQHRAQQIRNERAEQTERAHLEQEIRDQGITVLESEGYGDPAGYKPVTSLKVGTDYYAHPAPERLSVEVALAEAGNDLGALAECEWGRDEHDRAVKVWRIGYYVRNHRAHGWSHYNDKEPKAPLTDDEKAERKLARENGKVWVAATQVRRDWVKKLLERRSLPADWHHIPALVLAGLSSGFHYSTRDHAADLLQLERPGWNDQGYRNTLLDTVTTNPGQAAHVLLAIAVADLEARWDEKQGWKNHDTVHPVYLRQLSSWGYTLSDLEEQLVTNNAAGEESDD